MTKIDFFQPLKFTVLPLKRYYDIIVMTWLGASLQPVNFVKAPIYTRCLPDRA